ncbi:MAG TPA: Gfo/Idh/MocA family oxidoreductase [Cellulomonas sp.]
MRLAVVGAASSHVAQVLRLAAAGALGPTTRVTTLAVPDTEPVPAELLADRTTGGGSPRTVHRGDGVTLAAALAGQVDAVLVLTRDARTHRALADPLLRADLPLLVDKPFTADPDDAAHLVRLAAGRGLPLTSSSALRWHPDVQRARRRWRSEPGGIGVQATGPADPDDPHGGLATYAVHTVEAGLAVLRGPVGTSVTVLPGEGVRTAVVGAGRDVATITVLAPRGCAQTPFQLSVAGADDRTDARLDLGPDYLLPLLRAFVTGLAAGRATAPGPGGRTLVDTVRITAALSA